MGIKIEEHVHQIYHCDNDAIKKENDKTVMSVKFQYERNAKGTSKEKKETKLKQTTKYINIAISLTIV